MTEKKTAPRYRVSYSDLSFKDKAAYCTAILSFLFGWLLLFTAMLLPPIGEISAGPLTAFGTALVYSGSIFGVALYIKNSKTEIYADIMNSVSEKLEQHLKERDNGND